MSNEIHAFSKVTSQPSEMTSSLPEDSLGAPLARSPRGLAGLMKAPEIRVWARPLFRAAGMMGLLGCVAFLGKQSEEETNYGGRVELPSSTPSSHLREPAHETDTEGDSQPLAQAAAADPSPSPCAEQKTVQAPPAVLADGRIIMNEATQEDFTRLPGVGEARAKSIVELRTRMGKFRKVTDLLRVRGIGWKTLQAMKDLLVVDRPSEEKPDESGSASEAHAPRVSSNEAAVPGSRG